MPPDRLMQRACQELRRPVGAQWELRRALARADQCLGHRDGSVRAHVGRRLPRETIRQTAFRTSTGSSRSASRYSTRNGRKERMKAPRPDRIPVYGPGLKRNRERDSGLYAPQSPGNSHCAPTAPGTSRCSATSCGNRSLLEEPDDVLFDGGEIVLSLVPRAQPSLAIDDEGHGQPKNAPPEHCALRVRRGEPVSHPVRATKVADGCRRFV